MDFNHIIVHVYLQEKLKNKLSQGSLCSNVLKFITSTTVNMSWPNMSIVPGNIALAFAKIICVKGKYLFICMTESIHLLVTIKFLSYSVHLVL